MLSSLDETQDVGCIPDFYFSEASAAIRFHCTADVLFSIKSKQSDEITEGTKRIQIKISPAKCTFFALHDVKLGFILSFDEKISQFFVVNFQIRALDYLLLILRLFKVLKDGLR